MMAGAIWAEPRLSLLGLVLVLVGLPFYFWPRKRRPEPVEAVLEPVGN